MVESRAAENHGAMLHTIREAGSFERIDTDRIILRRFYKTLQNIKDISSNSIFSILWLKIFNLRFSKTQNQLTHQIFTSLLPSEGVIKTLQPQGTPLAAATESPET